MGEVRPEMTPAALRASADTMFHAAQQAEHNGLPKVAEQRRHEARNYLQTAVFLEARLSRRGAANG